jgi:hypothetical protein
MSDNTSRQQNICSDLLGFIRALCFNAAAYMTGGIVVAIIAVYSALGKTLPPPAVWSLVSLAFFLAAFNAYRKEFREKQSLQAELANRKEKKKIKESLAPLMFAIATRRAEIERMTNDEYAISAHFFDKNHQDIESIRVFTNAYDYINKTFGKTEAQLFASESGFPPFPENANHNSRDKLVYFLRQYESRLVKLIETHA